MDQLPSDGLGAVAVDDDRQRVDRLARHHYVELGHRRNPVARQMIVERSVSPRNRLQAIVKIEHDLIQRQLVLQHHARGTDIFKAFLLAALFLDQLQNAANILLVGQNHGENHRLFHFGDLAYIGPARGIIHLDHLAVRLGDLIAHSRRRRDQVEIVLALQAFLDDLHVQQAEKATAEAESERH